MIFLFKCTVPHTLKHMYSPSVYLFNILDGYGSINLPYSASETGSPPVSDFYPPFERFCKFLLYFLFQTALHLMRLKMVFKTNLMCSQSKQFYSWFDQF